LAERFHVGVVAVDAAAGFGELDAGDGGFGRAGGEAAGEVGVETFGTEDEEGSYWERG
jgi:hypothetical protein